MELFPKPNRFIFTMFKTTFFSYKEFRDFLENTPYNTLPTLPPSFAQAVFYVAKKGDRHAFYYVAQLDEIDLSRVINSLPTLSENTEDTEVERVVVKHKDKIRFVCIAKLRCTKIIPQKVVEDNYLTVSGKEYTNGKAFSFYVRVDHASDPYKLANILDSACYKGRKLNTFKSCRRVETDEFGRKSTKIIITKTYFDVNLLCTLPDYSYLLFELQLV